MTWLYVALGAAVGAPLRYAAGVLLDRAAAVGQPWGTIAVNAAGSFALGLCSGAALTGDALALVGTGFCGALTTYSSFAVQTHDRGPRRGAVTLLVTLVLAFAAVTAGFALGS